MLHIRQPFFSIATATIFAALGLIYSLGVQMNLPPVLIGVELDPVMGYVMSGLFFLMAYFSLVHLKYKS